MKLDKLKFDLQKKGIDADILAGFLFNQVLAHIKNVEAEYGDITKLSPEDLAEGILRSCIFLDEDSKRRAIAAQSKLEGLREKQLGENNLHRTGLL